MGLLLRFGRDESASVSIWNLFWLTGFIAIMGLAIDVTSSTNTKTRLQSVADASSHAGVMDITPFPDDAIETALGYARANMPKVDNVVQDADVMVGWWDHDRRVFYTGGNAQGHFNAVRVVATRDPLRDNALGTSVLGLVGLDAWNIDAIAIAAPLKLTQLPCQANDGLYAGGLLDQTSNNIVFGPFCMYGHEAFKIGQNNVVECGVTMMTPSTDTFMNGTPPVPTVGDCNPDYASLSSDEMIAQAFAYETLRAFARSEYEGAKRVLEGFVENGGFGGDFVDSNRVVPPYITTVTSVTASEFNKDARTGKLVPGTMYDVQCGGSNKGLELSGIVRNIAIFTDCAINVRKDKDVSAAKPTKTVTGTNVLCDPDDSTCESTDWLAEIRPDDWSCDASLKAGFEPYRTRPDTAGDGTYRDLSTDDNHGGEWGEDCGIEPGANGLWDNVMIFTSNREGGNVDQKSITFPNNMQLGRVDGCTEGGGVRIYSAGSIATPSGTVAHGVQIVTLGSVMFAAKADGAWGLNIQAAGDIKYTANGMMGGCEIDPEAGESEVVITARPIALVD